MTSRTGTVGPRVPICSGEASVTLWNGGMKLDLPEISYRQHVLPHPPDAVEVGMMEEEWV